MLFIVVLFATVIGVVVNGASSPSDTLINCICKQESGCQKPSPNCHYDVNGDACGYYQLHFNYFQDCSIPTNPGETQDAAWKRCSADLTCATRCVKNYLTRYGDYCAGKTATNEDFARVHNGGPSGCSRKCSGSACTNTLKYWNSILSKCPQLG